MAQWYVKELSKLTNISVQTLHHYDRINLLKPSVRLSNGYRVYSENDLLKLQQIVALKYFNFSLSQIKNLLSKPVEIIEGFTLQAGLLEKKAKALLEASQSLNKIVIECQQDKEIPWEKIIKVIDIYRLTESLERTWMGKAFTNEELKEYVGFEQQVKVKFSEQEQKILQKNWADLVKKVNKNLKSEPSSSIGIVLGQQCIEWVNNFYGRKFASLRTTIWDKGIKEGHWSAETGLSKEAAAWLDKAIDAYVEDRSVKILDLIKNQSRKTVLKHWEEMLNDFFGDNPNKKKEFCLRILKDIKLSKPAKDCLKSIYEGY